MPENYILQTLSATACSLHPRLIPQWVTSMAEDALGIGGVRLRGAVLYEGVSGGVGCCCMLW